MAKMKKKMNLGVLGMSPWGSKMVPQLFLDPSFLGSQATLG
jgi:hypothetical protein